MSRVFKNTKGFTLVEILIVVVMLAILFAIAVPIYTAYVEGARSAEAQEAISAIWSASKVYYAENHSWPNRIEQLRKLEFDQVVTRRWDFTITVGGRGINSITATSTGMMPGGAGKQVTFVSETGQWKGYGFE
ncbi:MAG: prepilin-type N-terminal cleavage/methylation domain-containing protein [candidate division Zixibacteria bacterium]|nr:prepilin-type N-terminal cleavage/methylation domain-containing protein [candidate division Zixibacteria bacterium]